MSNYDNPFDDRFRVCNCWVALGTTAGRRETENYERVYASIPDEGGLIKYKNLSRLC